MARYFLSLLDFARMIQTSPILLDRMLQSRGLDARLAGAVKAFLGEILEKDYDYYSFHGATEQERHKELMRLSNLPAELAAVPLSLYDNYCARVEQVEELELSEEELVFSLTFGIIPLDQYFFIEGRGFRFWDHRNGAIAGMWHEDINIHNAREQFLQSLPLRKFRSYDEVYETAQKEKWPGSKGDNSA